MEVVKGIEDLGNKVKDWKKLGYTIGLVPTMGFLHEGHGSLIEKAKKEVDKVIVSIFVNPTQFNNTSDLETYPRDLESDKKLIGNKGGDLVFAPEVEEVYGQKAFTIVDTSVLDENLCGATRPGHFRGVCTIVAKLFNMVMPHKAYFGKKDYQQLAIIKKMVEDLNFDIEVVGCDIVRSKDGLALSSRNSRLTSKGLSDALCLVKSMEIVEEALKKGEKEGVKLISLAREVIDKVEGTKIDYLNIVNKSTLENLNYVDKEALIAMAVWVEGVRLIDNRELKV